MINSGRIINYIINHSFFFFFFF
ncbi:hypothetical protein CP09DC79_0517, partial [Chlamydia psittaci 09DC79]